MPRLDGLSISEKSVTDFILGNSFFVKAFVITRGLFMCILNETKHTNNIMIKKGRKLYDES